MKDIIKIIILIGLLIIAALQACSYSVAEEISPDKFAADTELKDDFLKTNTNEALLLTVLENDARVLNSTLVFGEPQHGAIHIDSARGFIYVPAKGFKGKDSFQYRICGAGPCEHATVTIAVQ